MLISTACVAKVKNVALHRNNKNLNDNVQALRSVMWPRIKIPQRDYGPYNCNILKKSSVSIYYFPF